MLGVSGMEFVASAIISGIIYDCVKEGVGLTMDAVFKRNSGWTNSNIDERICKEFIDNVNDQDTDNLKIDYAERILHTQNKYTETFESQLYTTNFAKRLDYALMLINDTDYCSPRYNVEKLGEYLGFPSVNDLKKYYTTTEEPTYDFAERLADKMGLNPSWIKSGEGKPFESRLRKLYNGNDLFEEKDYKQVEEFLVCIKENSRERELILIKQIDELKYEYYPRAMVFYDTKGGAGRSELYSVYEMLVRLNRDRKLPSEVYCLSNENFDKLIQGYIYPGGVKKYERKQNMLEYFIDLDFSDKERLKKWYGQLFVDAQQYVREVVNLKTSSR